MRCNNCGWENAPGNAKCEKCNAPLKGSMVGSSPQPTPQPSSQNNSNSANTPLRGTLNERDAFGGGSSSCNGINIKKRDNKCPKCGYLVSSNMNTCPSCGTNLHTNSGNGATQTKTCAGCGVQLVPGAQFCSQCGRPVKMGTVNSGPQVGGGNFFTLRPIPWDKETVQYQPITYSGNSIDLNRDNTDPNNTSITSKLQAVITNVNGQWYIEDKSAFQSTLIHVRGKVKLQDGDIIILGNRKFEFKG